MFQCSLLAVLRNSGFSAFDGIVSMNRTVLQCLADDLQMNLAKDPGTVLKTNQTKNK
jgi:hypothetical protein